MNSLIEQLKAFAGIWINAGEELPDTWTVQPVREAESGSYIDPYDYNGYPLEKYHPEQLEWLKPSPELQGAIIAVLEEKEASLTDQQAAQNFMLTSEKLDYLKKYEDFDLETIARGAAKEGYLQACIDKDQELNKELQQLRQWKAEAIKVMPDMQKIGRLLNIPLGQSVHDKIIPALEILLNKK